MTDDIIQGGFFSQSPQKSKTYYFMAGLPRSGSTLLSSILNQNPKLYSGPSSPVLSTMYVIEQHLLNDELFHGFPKHEQGKEIISNVINHFVVMLSIRLFLIRIVHGLQEFLTSNIT